MKELRVQELRKARDLDAVQREPDGILKASAIAAVMCADSSIGVLGLDERGHEFVRAPLSIEGARWLAGEMTRLANDAERRDAEPSPDQRALGAAYQLAAQLVGVIEWPHLVPLLDMLSGDASRLDESFAPAPVTLLADEAQRAIAERDGL